MKFKIVIPIIVSLFVFGSCYKFDSLPIRYRITGEYALPVFDTNMHVADFDFFKDFGTSSNIQAGTGIYSGEQSYGLYFKDFYDNDNTIEWLEPKLIIGDEGKYGDLAASDNIPAGASVRVNIYTIDNSGGLYYFWLPPSSAVSGPWPTVIPDTPVRLGRDVIDKMKDVNELYFGLSLVFSNSMSYDQVKDYKIRARFGMKVNVKTTINQVVR